MKYGDPGYMEVSDRFVGLHCPLRNDPWKRSVLVNLSQCEHATLDESCPECYQRAISPVQIHCSNPHHPTTMTLEQAVLEDL